MGTMLKKGESSRRGEAVALPELIVIESGATGCSRASERHKLGKRVLLDW